MRELIKNIEITTSVLFVSGMIFLITEPMTSKAVEDQFVTSQSVTSEISFLIPAADITMSPGVSGTLGGTSNGSTYVKVLTNNTLGYSMTLTSSSSLGMIGDTQAESIPAYVPVSGVVPDFTFITPSNAARFGYTVEASTTSDLAQAFRDDGVSCNTGSLDTVGACWINASTTARQIINRQSSTPMSGATTTIKFRVVIKPDPAPAIPDDTYVSTTTLTATLN